MLERILEYFSKDGNLVKTIIGACVFLLCLILGKTVSKLVLTAFSRLFYKDDEYKRNMLVNSLIKPISAMIKTLGLFVLFCLVYTNDSIFKTFKIVFILIICWGVVSYLSDNLFLTLFAGKNADEKMNTTAIKFIGNIIKIIVIAFAVVMIISELGYNINGLLTGLGVGGLAVSLAAQDAVGNMISGFIIIFDKPFKVGDLIETPNICGVVEEVNMRSTKIRTLDDSLITVPNSTMTKEAVTNISMTQKRRIKLSFGLTYSTSNSCIEKIRNEIKAYITENDDILPSPLRVHFTEFEDSSLKIEVVCYTATSDLDEYLEIKNNLNLKIKQIVDNNETDFAFPTSTVYIER